MATLRTCCTALGVLVIVCTLGMPSRVSADDNTEDLVNVVLQKPTACDRTTKKNDLLSMHYTGILTDTGAKFDSSYDRGIPFEFQLGVGQVIPGWEQGLLSMCVGEKRKLIVPSHLAYGDIGAGTVVPPKASLTFEVELLDIKDGPTPPNVFKQIDANGDLLLTGEEVMEYMKEQGKKAQHMAPPPSDEQLSKTIQQIFDHEDKDKDGFISHEEFSGPKHDEL